MKELLLLIHRDELNLILLNKEIQFMRPINILTDIDKIIKSTMFKSYDNKSDQQTPSWQCFAIKLKESTTVSQNRNRSHIFIVQHQNSSDGNSNFEKLLDFLNYQRMSKAIKIHRYEAIVIENKPRDSYFEITQYHCK